MDTSEKLLNIKRIEDIVNRIEVYIILIFPFRQPTGSISMYDTNILCDNRYNV